jgi:hypothetical protein
MWTARVLLPNRAPAFLAGSFSRTCPRKLFNELLMFQNHSCCCPHVLPCARLAPASQALPRNVSAIWNGPFCRAVPALLSYRRAQAFAALLSLSSVVFAFVLARPVQSPKASLRVRCGRMRMQFAAVPSVLAMCFISNTVQ